MRLWDGVQFFEVPDEEGRRLVAENRAQCVDGFVAGHELKFPFEFTGVPPNSPVEQAPEVMTPPSVEPPEPEKPKRKRGRPRKDATA